MALDPLMVESLMIPTFVLGLESVYLFCCLLGFSAASCLAGIGAFVRLFSRSTFVRQKVSRYQFAKAHQQWRGVSDAFLDIGLEVGEGVRRGDTCRSQRFGVELVAAAHGDNRDGRRHGGG